MAGYREVADGLQADPFSVNLSPSTVFVSESEQDVDPRLVPLMTAQKIAKGAKTLQPFSTKMVFPVSVVTSEETPGRSGSGMPSVPFSIPKFVAPEEGFPSFPQAPASVGLKPQARVQPSVSFPAFPQAPVSVGLKPQARVQPRQAETLVIARPRVIARPLVVSRGPTVRLPQSVAIPRPLAVQQTVFTPERAAPRRYIAARRQYESPEVSSSPEVGSSEVSLMPPSTQMQYQPQGPMSQAETPSVPQQGYGPPAGYSRTPPGMPIPMPTGPTPSGVMGLLSRGLDALSSFAMYLSALAYPHRAYVDSLRTLEVGETFWDAMTFLIDITNGTITQAASQRVRSGQILLIRKMNVFVSQDVGESGLGPIIANMLELNFTEGGSSRNFFRSNLVLSQFFGGYTTAAGSAISNDAVEFGDDGDVFYAAQPGAEIQPMLTVQTGQALDVNVDCTIIVELRGNIVRV